MNRCIVFYESWQMECCGTDFFIGDTVKWLVYPCNYLNTPVDVGKVEYCYEAHDSDWNKISVLEGKVEDIKILYEKYEPSEENPKLLKSVGGQLIKSEKARGFEKTCEGMQASGYVVEISNCTIQPAKKEEVTFL